MAVLEGDYANLCGLGLPAFTLSLTLQTQNLQLSGALWTAKASASGFFISLYWPPLALPLKRRQRSPEGSGVNVNIIKVIPRASNSEITPELANL